jgi:hypothetical protein
VPGTFFTEPSGINDLGLIVGNYVAISPGPMQGVLATPTPTPPSFLLLGIGTLGLVGYVAYGRRFLRPAKGLQP